MTDLNSNNSKSQFNPFVGEENLTQWFEQDSVVLASQKTIKHQVQRSLTITPTNSHFTMSPNRLFTYITKHVFVSSIVAILALTTIGVAAAQALAPEQYKPSTLLGITKPKTEVQTKVDENSVTQSEPQGSSPVQTNIVPANQTNSNKTDNLVADVNHTIFNSPLCNIDFLYPKTYGTFGQNVEADQNPSGGSEFPIIGFDDSSSGNYSGPSKGVDIECLETDDIPSDVNLYKTDIDKSKLPYFTANSINLISSVKFYVNKLSHSPVDLDRSNYLITTNENRRYILAVYGDLTNSDIGIQFRSSPQTNNKISTYTNQYYPNLKIQYGSNWNLTTDTQASEYDNLVQRTIKLTKNKVTIEFLLSPKQYEQGCETGGGKAYDLVEDKILANGIKKSTLRNQDNAKSGLEISYSPNGNLACNSRLIESNIDSNISKKYKSSFSNDSKVVFSLKKTIVLKDGQAILSTEQLLNEIDQIIQDSVFK